VFGLLGDGQQLNAARLGGEACPPGALPAGGSVVAGRPSASLSCGQWPTTAEAENCHGNRLVS
jgi:hypothetical protein